MTDTGPCAQVFLKNMDTLLRCPICFDFLSIAMMSPCSHNFCSLCIRKFLSYKLQCPVCNSGMTEQDLRNNRILDDVVKNFQDARKRFAVSSAVKRKAPTPPSPGCRGPGEEEDEDEGSSALSLYFHSRRPSTSTTTTAAATATATATAAGSSAAGSSAACVSDSKEDDVEVVEVRSPRGKRARGSCNRTLTFNASQQQKARDPNNFTSIHVKKETTECDVTDHDSEVVLPSQSPRQPKGPKKVGSVLTDFFLKQPNTSSASSGSPKPKALVMQAQTPSSHRTTPAPFGSPEAEEEEEEAFQPTRSFKTRGQVKVKKEQPTTPLDSAPRARREPKPRRGRPPTRTSSQHTATPLSATESQSQTEASQTASTSTWVQVKEEKAEQDVFSPLSAGTLSGSTPVNKVECPVCEVPIPTAHINSHLDFCLRGAGKKESLRRSSGRRKPMAKVVYNLLSVAELKKRLKACELSTHGSKDQMVKRHQEFLVIYNAECDSLQPRSAKDIAKEVEANEKMRAQLEKTTKATMVFRKDQTEEEIEAVHSSYRKQHSSEFSRLVAQVRGRMRSSKTTRHIKEEAAKAEEETSSQAVTTTTAAAVETCPTIEDMATVPVAAHDRLEIQVDSLFQLDNMETCPTQRYTEPANEEMDTDQGLVSTERRLRSPSPTPSEVSVSSSISDVFS
ncbi:E3 ubiquitin-protein ligase RAD18 isoform X2 [Engraulis encrasicolus]|uniref:E3 ubiquitin-protein ligase RAD18 isoform X2 n=1 Tax=Engraulis encrasicolus TaxID=184585 RepID=UPI002FD5D2E2